MSSRKQVGLAVRLGYAPARQLEIVQALLDADKLAAKPRACHTRRAAAHKRVQHGFTGVGELQNPVGNERQRLLRRMFAMLDATRPDGMVATAIPALFAFAVKNGNRLPPRGGPVAGELRSASQLVPDAEAHKWETCSLKARDVPPLTRHNYPASGERNRVGAERHEPLLP